MTEQTTLTDRLAAALRLYADAPGIIATHGTANHDIATAVLTEYDAEQVHAERVAKRGLTRFVGEAARNRAIRLVDLALERGYRLGVHDGEEWVLRDSTDREAVLDAMASTDHDLLRIENPAAKAGNVMLIWENGEDVISDYHCAEHIEALVSDVSEAFGD